MDRKLLIVVSLAVAFLATPAFGAIMEYKYATDSLVGVYHGPATGGAADLKMKGTVSFTSMFSMTDDGTPVANSPTTSTVSFQLNLKVSYDSTEDAWLFSGPVIIKDSRGVVVIAAYFTSDPINEAYYDTVQDKLEIRGTLDRLNSILEKGSAADSDPLIRRNDPSEEYAFVGTDRVGFKGYTGLTDFGNIMSLWICTGGVSDQAGLIEFFNSEEYPENPICFSKFVLSGQYVYPEPMTMSLLAVGGLALLRRRSR